MSNLYLIEILIEPNSLTIVTSKKKLKTNNYVLLLSIFFHNEKQQFAVFRKSSKGNHTRYHKRY